MKNCLFSITICNVCVERSSRFSYLHGKRFGEQRSFTGRMCRFRLANDIPNEITYGILKPLQNNTWGIIRERSLSKPLGWLFSNLCSSMLKEEEGWSVVPTKFSAKSASQVSIQKVPFSTTEAVQRRVSSQSRRSDYWHQVTKRHVQHVTSTFWPIIKGGDGTRPDQ